MPERFGLEYIGTDNKRHKVVVIHRTLLGSMERFIGGLIEHYGGAFPIWMAPEQVRLLPVSEQWSESALEFAKDLERMGIRVGVETRDTLGYRIRDAETLKTPYMGVIGERESADGTVAVRKRGSGRKQEIMERSTFKEKLLEEIQTKSLG